MNDCRLPIVTRLSLPKSDCRLRAARARRGFSFTEILFAVMILGIGFIMVAAMFPVALQQTESSNSETIGASVARAGAQYMAQLAQSTWAPATAPTANFSFFRPTFLLSTDEKTLADYSSGQKPIPAGTFPTASGLNPAPIFGPVVCVNLSPDNAPDRNDVAAFVNGHALANPVRLSTLMGSAASQNMIQSADPRFAWVGFYCRGILPPAATPGALPRWLPYAQIIVIAAQARSKSQYQSVDVSLQSLPAGATTPLQPTLFQNAQLFQNGTSAGLSFPAASGAGPGPLAEGAFAVIVDDTAFSSPNHSMLNGRVFRLGVQPDPKNPQQWEFSPGNGLTAGDINLLRTGSPPLGSAHFSVYVVGAAPDPDNPTQNTGAAQDVAVYSTFVQVTN